jgi:integrase
MKLTSKTIAALRMPPGKKEHFEWDDELPGYGLRLRLASGGKLLRTFNLQFRRAGAQRRLLLGSADVLTAEQARKAAKNALAEIQLGRDPAAERRERRDKDKVTLRSVIDEYLAAKQGELRAKTMREITRYLTASPYFGPLFRVPIDAVGRRDVALRVAAITREHGPIVARRARAALSAFLVWCMRMGIIEHNVVIGTIEPKDGKPRDRVLTDSELRRIWLACQDDDYGRIIKLCGLLGVRRAEAGGMAWSELNLEGPQPSWTIPGTRTKNHHPHTLPLMPMAIDIIRRVPERVSRDQLFGSHSPLGFVNWDLSKRALDKRSGVAGWTPHDLRRTLSTRLHDLGVAPHVVEALLNHRSGHRAGVAGVYNRATYEREIRAALALWEDYLAALLDGGERKVFVLPQQSA